jgi:hypothetical protein
MKRSARIEAYLDAVTSGLAGDDELRLDIRAELASHLDEATDQRRAEGLAPDPAEDEAIGALGPAADYAGDLVDANRTRMRWRGRLRLLLRALPVPLALLLAACSWRGCTMAGAAGLVGRQMTLGESPRVAAWLLPVARTLQRIASGEGRLTVAQRLVLHGDPDRADRVQSQRAIWEAWPTNVVYLNNYLAEALARAPASGAPETCRATLEQTLEEAIALDPRNARYHYIRAAGWLEPATALEPAAEGKTEKLVVRDRAALDRAMAEFMAGIRKPVLRRYSADMLRERLAIMGPPRSLLEQISQIGVAAGTLLPDLSSIRRLVRTSAAYAALLVQEGRMDEAKPYLDAWRTLSVQLSDDSYTLIDVLFASAVAKIGQEKIAPFLREMGDVAAADLAQATSAALCAPADAFRARVKAFAGDEQTRTLRHRAGVLAGMLLPALGEQVAEEDLTPGRLLEYVLLDQSACGAINLVLLAAMLGALLVALRWRFVRRGRFHADRDAARAAPAPRDARGG